MLHSNTEIRKKLNTLGLTEKETLVYLSLAKFDTVGIGKLAVETGLTPQNLYNYIESLKNKNLAGEVLNKNKKAFFAKDIKNLQQSFQKKIELINLVDNELAEYKIKYAHNIKLYKGLTTIRHLFIERMKRQPQGSQIFSNETSSLDFTGQFMGDKFNLYENVRINRKFKVNVMLIIEDKAHLAGHAELTKNKRQFNETRIIHHTLFGSSALYIWSDRVWILIKDSQEKFEILEIISQEIVASFKFYFQYIWSSAQVVYQSQD